MCFSFPDFWNHCLLKRPLDITLENTHPIYNSNFVILISLEGDLAEKLGHVGQVVLVLAVAGAGVRLEQEVPGGELEGHAGRAPDVRRGPVPRPDDHLQRPVLPRLNVVSEVMMLPARVTKVRNLNTQGRTLVKHGILKT